MQNRDQSATIDLNSGKQVNRIATSDGTTWKLPDGSRDQAASQSPDLNAYLAANSSLLDVAKQIDIENGSAGASGYDAFNPPSGATGSPDPKSGASLTDPLRAVLLVFASIWYPLLGIFPGLFTVFTIASVLQGAMVGRFDGDWAATNGKNTLILTIAQGKITRMLEPSSGEELNITDSELKSVDGDHVVWSVDVTVLGQAVPVTFEFDVQEMSDGSLQGTLTTMGSNFARVPVTMTRT